MRAILAVPRFAARLVIRFRRWITPSPDQQMRSTKLRKQARQQAHDAMREHYTRGGAGSGWR